MKLLELVPAWIKYPLLFFGFIAYAPSWISEKYDQKWDAKAAPHIKVRDIQFKELEKDLADIKEDTRDIKRILMERR